MFALPGQVAGFFCAGGEWPWQSTTAKRYKQAMADGTSGNSFSPAPGDALVVIDVQCDFLPGGALAVPHGDEVIPPLNRYIAMFELQRLPIFATRDWHPRESLFVCRTRRAVAGALRDEYGRGGILARPETAVACTRHLQGHASRSRGIFRFRRRFGCATERAAHPATVRRRPGHRILRAGDRARRTRSATTASCC